MPNDQLAHIRFVHGHILWALHRDPGARGLLEKAWDAYYVHFDPRFSWRRLLVEDLVAACTALGDETAAQKWRGLLDKDAPEEQRGPQ
jgi:hypothetical protein